MTIRDYAHLLRRRWLVVALAALAGVAGATVVTESATPMYASTVRLFVTTPDPAHQVLLTQGRLESYAALANSRQMAAAIIHRLGLEGRERSTRLADRIAATVPTNTMIIDVTVRDRSPEQAKLLANTLGAEFPEIVRRLEPAIVEQNAGDEEAARARTATQPALTKPLGTAPNDATRAGGRPQVAIRVADPAALPSEPVSPRKGRDVLVGLVLGLVGGLGAAILLDVFDTRIRRPEVLRDDFALPVLGVVVRDRNVRRLSKVVEDTLSADIAEEIRQLRTSLEFADHRRNPKTVLVTSSVPAEGKSTVAALLARATAAAGKRTLLVECDVRAPALAKRLGLADGPGLVHYLRHEATAGEIVQRVPMHGTRSVAGRHDVAVDLACITAGTTDSGFSELLEGAESRAFFAKVGELYDSVIVDSPPLLPFADAALLASMTDATLLVVRANRTSRDMLRRCLETLEGVNAPVAGAVLNMAARRGPDAVQRYDSYYRRYNRKDTGFVETFEPVFIDPGERNGGAAEAPAAPRPRRDVVASPGERPPPR